MGFIDKLRQAISGTREKNGDAKDAGDRAEMKVEDSADGAKRAANKSDNAANNAAASDELKKD